MFSPQGNLTSYTAIQDCKRPKKLPVFIKMRPGPGIAALPPQYTYQAVIWKPTFKKERNRIHLLKGELSNSLWPYLMQYSISIFWCHLNMLHYRVAQFTRFYFFWAVHLSMSESQEWLLNRFYVSSHFSSDI